MLAIIQDEKRLAFSEVLHDYLAGISSAFLPKSEDRDQRLFRLYGIRRIAQLHQPDAVGERVDHFGADLQRQPRLPTASRSVKRHQSMALHKVANGSHLFLAPDQAGQLDRKVVSKCRERPQRGKLRTKIRMVELVDLLRPLQVFEVMLAQVD